MMRMIVEVIKECVWLQNFLMQLQMNLRELQCETR